MVFKNAISWFEIPTTDLDRATKFYETIFGCKLNPLNTEEIRMRLFPLENTTDVGGAIVDSKGFHRPSSTEGPLIYLNANPDVEIVLSKVESAGGKVLVPKTSIGQFGFMGVFIDTEGNRIGLHSIPQ